MIIGNVNTIAALGRSGGGGVSFDYVAALQNINDINEGIFYSVESGTAFNVFLKVKDKLIKYRYIKDGNNFWVNEDAKFGQMTANKNYISETGVWIKPSNGNYYTNTIGSSISVTFKGTSISFRHFCENTSARMRFVLDGDTGNPVDVLGTGTGVITTPLFSGLTDVEHTVVGTFEAGTRYFVRYSTGLSGLDSETFIITGSEVAFSNAVILKTLSNIEIAYTQKKYGASYSETFFPYHTAVTSLNTLTEIKIDGNLVSLSVPVSFTACNEIKIKQIANVFNNNEPASITGVCDMVYIINRQGIKIDFSISFPQKVNIEKGYPFMHVCYAANYSKLHYNGNGGILLSSLDQVNQNTIPNSDSFTSYMFESSILGLGLAMRLNNKNALRLAQNDRITPIAWIQKTSADKWKLYQQAFYNSVIEQGYVYTGSASYYAGYIN